MFVPFQISIFETVIGGVTLAAVLGMWGMLLAFIKKQNVVNSVNKAFQRSQQRAEIMRAFQRHVEDGHPMTPDELAHLEDCYKAYHESGGNGTGTFMYDRIKRYAVLITRVEEESRDAERERTLNHG